MFGGFFCKNDSALEARFNEVSLSGTNIAATTDGASSSGPSEQDGGDDVGSLRTALAQARSENEALIGKMKELLGRHRALQTAASDLKAKGEEAAG